MRLSLVQLFRRLMKRPEAHACPSACEKKATEELHWQANRLHVIEYEAYGHPNKRRRPQ